MVFHFKSIATPEHRLSQPQSAVNAGSLITRRSLKFFWSIINVLMSLAPRLLWVSVDSTFLLILQALNSCRDNAGIGLVTKLLLKNKLEGVIIFFFCDIKAKLKLQVIWNCVYAIIPPHQAHQLYLLTCDIFIQEECGIIHNYRQYTSSKT